MILAKKRRLSQTDTGKSRKPTTQMGGIMTSTSVTGSADSRQDVVINGDGAHTPTDVTNEDSTKDDAFNTDPPVTTNDAGNEMTSPQESQQPDTSCSGTRNNIVAIKIRGRGVYMIGFSLF